MMSVNDINSDGSHMSLVRLAGVRVLMERSVSQGIIRALSPSLHLGSAVRSRFALPRLWLVPRLSSPGFLLDRGPWFVVSKTFQQHSEVAFCYVGC